ncbi:unnamed protein product [Laminaria digitata]
MEIQQEPDSLQIITEIDPLDIAEMLGNVGGFWDLILILWPICFVAATRESPRLKPRNLKKSVTRAAERAKGLKSTVSIARQLRRSMPTDGLSGRRVQRTDQPVERPYWEPTQPAYKSTKPLATDNDVDHPRHHRRVGAYLQLNGLDSTHRTDDRFPLPDLDISGQIYFLICMIYSSSCCRVGAVQYARSRTGFLGYI